MAEIAGVVAGGRGQGEERVGGVPPDAPRDGRRSQDGAARVQVISVLHSVCFIRAGI